MEKPKTILIIEDDESRVDLLESLLKTKEPDVNIEKVVTEKEFVDRFTHWVENPPALVIIDQMIPYTSGRDEEEHPEAEGLNTFEGGRRCYRMLKENSTTKNVPTIFYSILPREKVPEGAEYVRKSGDAKQMQLLSKIRERLLGGSEKAFHEG